MNDVNDALANLLFIFANRISRVGTSVLDRLAVPLTYSQFRLLARVAEGNHTLAVLASYGGLSMPTLSESISVLARRGLLVRHPSPADRRAILVYITPEGRKALRAGQEELHRTAVDLLPADLGDDTAKAELFRQLLSIFDLAEGSLPEPLTNVHRGLSSSERSVWKGSSDETT